MISPGRMEVLMAQENPGLDSAPSVHAVATVAASVERRKLTAAIARGQ